MRHSNPTEEEGGDFLIRTGPTLLCILAVAISISWYVHFVPYPGYLNPLDVLGFVAEILVLAVVPINILIFGRMFQRSRRWITDAPVIGALMFLIFFSFIALSGTAAFDNTLDHAGRDVPAASLPEEDRADFVRVGHRRCVDSAIESGATKGTGLNRRLVSDYCRCSATGIFDSFSVHELDVFASNSWPTHMQRRVNDIMARCLRESRSRQADGSSTPTSGNGSG